MFLGLIIAILLGASAGVITTSCTKQELKDTTDLLVEKGESAVDQTKEFFSNDTKRLEAKINISSFIAGTIVNSNLKGIDLHNIQSFEDYKGMVEKLNVAVKILNEKAGTEIKYFSKEPEAYDKYLIEVERWTPLVDNYNALINVSRNFDSSNVESTNMVIKKSIGFTVESVLIVGGVFYKVTYMAIGTFANYFGLTKLASICSTCVSAVMSTGHWVVRNGAIDKTSQLAEKSIP